MCASIRAAAKLGEAGAVECVVGAIGACNDAQVQQVAVRALNNLCTEGEWWRKCSFLSSLCPHTDISFSPEANVRRAVDARGLEAVESVLEAQADNGELHYRVSQLLPVLQELEEEDHAEGKLEQL